MAGPTRDQKLDTLLAAAAEVFAERGYHETSMRDLARSAGISLAGVYYYVQSKEELLFLIQSRNFEAVIAGMREALDGVTDPLERIARFIDNHLDYFATHMAEMKVLSHEAGALTGDATCCRTSTNQPHTRSGMPGTSARPWRSPSAPRSLASSRTQARG